MEPTNTYNYIKSLVNYVGQLVEQKYLGKVLYYFNSIEIRQLIYKKHRILYYVYHNEIRVMAVLHTAQDLKSAIDYIERYF